MIPWFLYTIFFSIQHIHILTIMQTLVEPNDLYKYGICGYEAVYYKQYINLNFCRLRYGLQYTWYSLLIAYDGLLFYVSVCQWLSIFLCLEYLNGISLFYLQLCTMTWADAVSVPNSFFAVQVRTPDVCMLTILSTAPFSNITCGGNLIICWES